MAAQILEAFQNIDPPGIDDYVPFAVTRASIDVSFAGTKRQAQIRCAELIAELQSGGGIDPSNISVGEFLVRWLDHMQGQVSPKSLERYTEIACKNLIPLLGS